MDTYGPSWERSCDLLVKALQSLDRKTASIRRSTNKLVSIKDINKEREKVKQATGAANSSEVQLIQDQLRQIERFIKLDAKRNVGGVKLMKEAEITLNAYQRACDNFYKRCIAVEESSHSQQMSRTTEEAFFEKYSTDPSEATQPLLKDGAGGGSRLTYEVNLHQEILEERAKETQEIADSVKDIHEIFLHVHEMVEEQGGQLETVSVNVATSERATLNANENLRRAQQYQENPCPTKLLLFLVIVMFSITITVLILT